MPNYQSPSVFPGYQNNPLQQNNQFIPQQNYQQVPQQNPQINLSKLANKIKLLKLTSALLSFLLIASIILTSVLILSNGTLINNNKAAVNTFDNLINPAVSNLDLNSNNKTYFFELGNYEFTYDSALWALPAIVDGQVVLSEKSDNIVAVSTSVLASRKVYFSSEPKNNRSIDDYYNIKKQEILSNGSKFIEEGVLKVNGNNYKYISTETSKFAKSVANKSLYDTYYFVQDNDLFYIVNLHTVNQISGANQLVNTILVSLKYTTSANSGAVKGASDQGAVDASEKAIVSTRSSVYRIYNKSCGSYSFNSVSNLPAYNKAFGGKTISDCIGSTGTGFVIDDKCHLGTNGHVVVSDVESNFISQIASSQDAYNVFVSDFLQLAVTNGDITSQQASKFISNPNDKDLQGYVFNFVYELLQNKVIDYKFSEPKIFVQKLDVPLDHTTFFDEKTAATEEKKAIPAKVLAMDFDPKALITGKFTTSDVAIITADTKCDTLLESKLGDINNVTSGSSLLVVGFPGTGTDDILNQGLSDLSSTSQQTITRGVLSAIKKDQSGHTLIQTDASVNHGNSGGPCYDINGNVVGIASMISGDTYGAINFCRDIKDLVSLMDKNNLKNDLNNVTNLWVSGVNAYYEKKYYSALDNFAKVEVINPAIQDLDKLTKSATDNKANAIDSADNKKTDNKNDGTLIAGIVSGSITGVIFIALLIVLIMLVTNKSKYKKLVAMYYPQPRYN
ncbi:MAG: trypsin-like peptidase domain-containing protein [bacterium]